MFSQIIKFQWFVYQKGYLFEIIEKLSLVTVLSGGGGGKYTWKLPM